MRGINLLVLLGNVGRDPKITVLKSGDTVASFPVATTEVWTDKDSVVHEETEWHNIVCWKGLAESVKKSELKKSDTVHIIGKIKTRTFTDKEGEESFIREVIADSFTITRRYSKVEKETVNHEA